MLKILVRYISQLRHSSRRRSLAIAFAWILCTLIFLRYVMLSTQSSLLLLDRGSEQHMLDTSSVSGRSTPIPEQLKQLMKLQPLVDTSPSLSEEQLLSLVQQLLDSLPAAQWLQSGSHPQPRRYNKTCARLPKVYELKFNNLYWQVMESSNGTYNFYAAYYDDRPALHSGPLVRMLVMIDRIQPTLKTYCQFWFEGQSQPVIVPLMEYKYVWNKKWGNFKQGILQLYLMACVIPKTHRGLVPAAVSVVEKPCETATVVLRVINNRPLEGTKKQFAVCVKGLSFPDEDLSVRLVEWLEMIKLLGAHKVVLYQLEIHPNMTKVLQYYEKLGLVELRPLTLAGEQPNLSWLQRLYLRKKITNKRQSELVPYNDCFYRNMNLYDYLVLIDTDEVIMPLQHNNWDSLMHFVRHDAEAMEKKQNKTYASYNVRNVYFFGSINDSVLYPDIPAYMHMLHHVRRSFNYTKAGHSIKSFHRTDRVIALHNHFPLACIDQCKSYSVSTKVAQMQHYRSDCIKLLSKSCESDFKKHTVLDTNIWRFRQQLVVQVTRTLLHLNFLPPEGAVLLEYIESGASAVEEPAAAPPALAPPAPPSR